MNSLIKDIYVRVGSLNYWWGIYGFETKTGWEDIEIYERRDTEYVRLGHTCLCSKAYLRSGLKDLEKDESEADFVQKIKDYLSGDKMDYHYYYDLRSDEDFYELPYTNLPLNSHNVKPRSFEMWHPDERIDWETIQSCVRTYCSRYLEVEAASITYYEGIPMEEAQASFKEEQQRLNRSQLIMFSDELIESAMSKTGKTREDVHKMLSNSIK